MLPPWYEYYKQFLGANKRRMSSKVYEQKNRVLKAETMSRLILTLLICSSVETLSAILSDTLQISLIKYSLNVYYVGR